MTDDPNRIIDTADEIYIAIINDRLARHPALAHLPSPVTINHVKYPCDDCGDTSWIGPKQHALRTANPGRARAVCYRCIITKDRYTAVRQQFESGDVHGLSNDADNQPRMWP